MISEKDKLAAVRSRTVGMWAVAAAIALMAVAIASVAWALHEQTAMCYGTWEAVE